MADVPNILSTIAGLLKSVYADKTSILIPSKDTILVDLTKDRFEQLGAGFIDSILLTDEQSVTYEGETSDASTLEDAVALSSAQPTIKGCQITVKSQYSYKVAAAAMAQGKAAFEKAVALIMESNGRTHTKRLERSFLYGRNGLGTFASSANSSATVTVAVITAKEFGPGLFVGAVNAKIEVWNVNTQVGTGAFTITEFNLGTRALTLSGAAGDISALDTAIAANPDVLKIFYKGAKSGANYNECLGLYGIMTASSTLFGVTVGDLHKSQQYDANDADIDFAVISKAMVRSIFYGAEGDFIALMSPAQMQKLNRREVDPAVNNMAKREFSAKKVEKGSYGFIYQIQGREVEAVCHPMVKDSHVFILPRSSLKRVGAWKESLKNPATGSIEVIQRENKNVCEWKSYSDQALYATRVAHLTLIHDLKVSDLY
jgi:hypothetical protein